MFKEESSAAIHDEGGGEDDEIKMVTNPSLRRGLSRLASSKKQFSLRAIGSKQSCQNQSPKAGRLYLSREGAMLRPVLRRPYRPEDMLPFPTQA